MAKARFFLKKNDNPKKETPIFIVIHYNKKRLRISTGLYIQPKYWNHLEQQARNIRGFTDLSDRINDKLKELKIVLEEAYDDFKKKGIIPNIDELKTAYQKKLVTEDALPQLPEFWSEFDRFIETSKGRVVKDVIKDYNSLKKHLLGFQKHIKREVSFENLNYAFYQKFTKYLTYNAEKPNGEQGLSINTVGKQIKNLKVFLNYCFKYEIIERFDLSSFKTVTEDTEAIFLSENEINQIYNTDLSNHLNLKESRDLLVLGCQLGLRSSDLFRLKPDMIRNGMIRITMKKTSKAVVIPLNPLAKEIINKYNGDFPNKKNRNSFNADLKKIGEIARIDDDIIITKKRGIEKQDISYKKYELMSSHICRRSFCTNQYLKGVPTVFLMKISGHSTEKAFLRYIKIDEEMAARKMLEYWQQ